MGILRNTLIIGIIAIALPSPPPSENKDGVVVPQAAISSYVSAAAETFADVRTFCQRQPGVCTTAGHIAGTVEAKAKFSAKLIYEWANEVTVPTKAGTQMPQDLATIDPIQTGSTPIKRQSAESQSTLRLEDLLPEWQAPAKPKKG